jgi:periplasmic divalent cation tolerance protein
MSKYVISFVTTDTKKLAIRIASRIVQEKLAACVNIIDGMRSIYRWKGKIEKTKETLLIIKTRKNLTKDLIVLIKKLHTYTTPEIIFFEIDDGEKNYLNWIRDNTLLTSGITNNRREEKK